MKAGPARAANHTEQKAPALSGGGPDAAGESSFGQLIEEASFPVYVCDLETDELLYVNRKAGELLGGDAELPAGKPCYACLMHRDSPCPFCRKELLTADRFTSFDVFQPGKKTFLRVQGKLIRWNGRSAQARYLMEATLAEEIVSKLFGIDYETITTIDAATGEARPFISGHLAEVLAEQERAGDHEAGVAAYLRRYCGDDDVERIVRETSLPYIKEQLKTKPSHSVAYSLRQNGGVVRKRVIFAYLDQNRTTILCAMQDITELYTLERTRQEQIATALQTLQELGGMNVARYDLKTKRLYSNSDMATKLGYGEVIENFPEEFIARGLVAPASAEEYRRFFEQLRAGRDGVNISACKVADGAYHWLRIDARLLYDEENKPYQAILSFKDIEEQREHAAVYQKWRQSFAQKKQEEYTLFRCNLSKGASFDKIEGALLHINFDPAINTFNERTREYAGRYVHLDDFDAYTALLNSENLLAGYYRGTRTASLAYRERVAEEEYRWLHLTVEMTQYPDSLDIEVFLMYELSDSAQREDSAVRARLDADPLTGILNRRAFTERLNALLEGGRPDARHALILADIDGFRRINESFGHAVGDQALIDIGKSLQEALRAGDLLGRLGGDVFLLCLANLSGQAAAEQRAVRLLSILRRAFSVDIRLSASMGIAFYPIDGADFSTLYHSADLALLAAKANGKDSFVFFSGELVPAQEAEPASAPRSGRESPPRRHMLLVDNDPETRRLLEATYQSQYRVEVCATEREAAACLHRYGLSLSVILLNLDAPGVNAFSFMDRIQTIASVRSVPVIALGRVDERERGLQALRHGASDFILAPVDPRLLKTRIDSAVSKAENERLRAQNTYLQTRVGDAAQFHNAYENADTVVVEYDWETCRFVYDPAISAHLLGRYDDRPLWQIFMADMVADVQDVKIMQEFVMSLANSRTRTSGTLDVMLKTPARARHWFAMNAFKRVNDRNLPSKIILTFLDVNEDILASKQLRFQAEHDSLTGLYNRGSFLKLVESTVRLKPADSYILLSCDINDFRFINEHFGREEGDRVLQYAAERLLTYANAPDSFAGRLSNDVFSILLPNTPGILHRTTALIRDFFSEYPLGTKITGRAGAYRISDPGMTADSMLDMAATAKESIRGKFAVWLALYDDSMNEMRLRQKRITDRMETALADGQFDVYFQPQFHHATGRIVGAEALARWIDPERGVVPPGEFIPVFEKNGFITRLDAYIWEKTAQYVGAWMARGHVPVPVSVNVSREDTNDPALCEKLLSIVERYHIPIDLFRLEITEGLFAEDAARLTDVVRQLHEAGFLIGMDDFGSGYSSLNILKDVPVDILKLDMKFFSGNDGLGRGGMIINAVLRMSRWLGIPVVAEGVELKEQADFLLSVGCPTIQGFLYEKPIPAAAFERMLLARGKQPPAAPQDAIDTELEARRFWDPASADSQIFNRYIGPAVVFEYHDGVYEIVRMNARFIDAMQIKEPDRLPALGMLRLCEEDKPALHKAVLEAVGSCKDVRVDLRSVLEDGSAPLFHAVLRVIAKSADRALLFCVLDV